MSAPNEDIRQWYLDKTGDILSDVELSEIVDNLASFADFMLSWYRTNASQKRTREPLSAPQEK
jgi:hypothetical protein